MLQQQFVGIPSLSWVLGETALNEGTYLLIVSEFGNALIINRVIDDFVENFSPRFSSERWKACIQLVDYTTKSPDISCRSIFNLITFVRSLIPLIYLKFHYLFDNFRSDVL
jgi:hypothetical protein